jgi:bifunctional non-homologous end joining protein LigD
VLPRIEPARLTVARNVFSDPSWLYELKYDGFRAVTYVNRGTAWMVSKKGFVYKRFQELCHHVASAFRAREAILDGEIICMDAQGRPRFYDLMFRRGEPRLALFDILWLDGKDLRDLPLVVRKKMLRKLVPMKQTHLLYIDHVKDGVGLYNLVCEQDLEGVVMKPKQSPYSGNGWLKVRNPDYTQIATRHELFNRK